MEGNRLIDHLENLATLARQEATLESREGRVQHRLRDLADARGLTRRMALERLLEERTVEVAAGWVDGEKAQQAEVRKAEAELAGVQAQRRLVRDALVTAARRWVFSNDEQSERSH